MGGFAISGTYPKRLFCFTDLSWIHLSKECRPFFPGFCIASGFPHVWPILSHDLHGSSTGLPFMSRSWRVSSSAVNFLTWWQVLKLAPFETKLFNGCQPFLGAATSGSHVGSLFLHVARKALYSSKGTSPHESKGWRRRKVLSSRFGILIPSRQKVGQCVSSCQSNPSRQKRVCSLSSRPLGR